MTVADAPVWPVQSPAELAGLTAVAKLFGSTLQSVQELLPSSQPGGNGCVAAIGEAAPEGALYAHLTGRQANVLESVAGLSPTALPDVILSVAPRIDPELVRLLMEAPPGDSCCGVVWGRTADELHRNVLYRAAAAVLNGPLETGMVEITLDDDAVRETGAGNLRLGTRAPLDRAREALEGGAGLVALTAHGHGWHIEFATDKAICSAVVPPEDGDYRSPACHETGICSVTHDAVSVEDRRLIPPESVSARVLALISCQSVLVDSEVLDSAWSPLPRLALSPNVGAILGFPDLGYVNPPEVSEQLNAFLAEGDPIGRAAARYMNAPNASTTEQRLVVFGDPRTRAGVSMRRAPRIRVDAVAKPAPAPIFKFAAEDANLHVLRSVALYVQTGMEHVGRQTSQEAMAALREYETRRDAGEDDAAAGTAMRRAIIAHLATMKGRPYLGWNKSDCQVVRENTWQPCPNCGYPVRGYHCTLPSGIERWVLNCPRCTDIRDQPLNSSLDVRLSQQMLELVGEVPERNWDAAVLLVPSMVQETQTAVWPADDLGRAQRQMELDFEEWPAGSFLVRVLVISDTSVDALGMRMRAPSGVKIRNLRSGATLAK